MKRLQTSLLLITIFSICPFLGMAQANPKLDVRWIKISNTHTKAGDILTTRLQVRSESSGHQLLCADFYIYYDDHSLSLNSKPLAGTDYILGTSFDTSLHSNYKFSKLANNLYRKSNDSFYHIVDVALIDTNFVKGAVLDSDVWTDVADINWNIIKPGTHTRLEWRMNESGTILEDVFERLGKNAIKFSEGEGWHEPFVIKLE